MIQSSLLLPVLAQQQSQGNPIIALFFFLVWLALIVVIIAGLWKTFEKAGQPGWAAIIPIYNIYVLLQIARRPGWWLLLFFIPFVNFLIMIVVCMDVAKNFGKDSLFGLGLAFLGFIFFPILGFGDAAYQPAAEQRGSPMT